MKTDLKKILSVSGEQGLFLYVSQGKSGIIAESLITKKRMPFGIQAKVTSLSDISIYTDDEEMPLRDVLLKMKETLGEADAPAPKSDAKVLVKFFEEVIPDYDRDKFYTSHMKKVVQWYNVLKQYASLDFIDPEEEGEQQQEEGQPQNEGQPEVLPNEQQSPEEPTDSEK